MFRLPTTRWLLVALVLLIGIVALACDEDEATTGGTSTEEPTVAGGTPEGTPTPPDDVMTSAEIICNDPAAEKGEVRWGVMFELSGGLYSGFGIPTSDGLKLAVEEVNEAGGFQVGDTCYTITLIERDTRSDIPATISAATELVRDEGVNVIWGPATVGETEATRITQPQEILHLCPCQERELNALSSVEKAKGESRWAFQTLLPFSLLIGQGARNFLEEWPDFDTMALLCENSESSRDVCSRTREAYEAVGIEVTGEEYFPPETADFSPFLTNLRGGDPDYVFNFSSNPLSGPQIVRHALEQGVGRLHIVTVPADVVESLVGRELTVPVTVGAVGRQSVVPTSEEAADYFERYRAFKGGELPFASFVSLLTYDFVYMLAGAMQRAGTVEDTTAIAAELETLHYDGVAENDLFFNSRHLAVLGTEPCVVQSGQPIRCEHMPPPPEAME
jgi:ABC-type branched-subunit amino acid transport system substrate-binding protein